jgi:hypothetical protein
MTLNTHPRFPATGGYVLKVHRDARPEAGHLLGRIEHIASGDHFDFDSSDALLAWLLQHAAVHGRPPPVQPDTAPPP